MANKDEETTVTQADTNRGPTHSRENKEPSDRLPRVAFVDDPNNPQGRGRLDLATGERF